MIRDRDELWSAVDEALDARRDPLADAAVQAWIADHPEDLEALGQLDHGLRAIASAPSAPRAREAKPILALVCAAALVLAVLATLREDGATLHEQRAAPRSAVLDYRIQVSTERPDGRVVATLENGCFTGQREQKTSTDNAVAHVTITTRKEGLR